MIRGAIIYKDLKFLTETQEPTQPIQLQSCRETMPVFWHTTTDEYKNDRSSFIFFSGQDVTTAQIFLIDGETEIPLTDNTYGVFYPYGFITNRLGQKAIGYTIDWRKVNDAYGEGKYKVRCKKNKIFGGQTIENSIEYTLMMYTMYRADMTTRLEWNMNGICGDYQEGKWDYMGSNFYMQIRIPNSSLIETSPNIETTYEKDTNGRSILTQKEITRKYKFGAYKLRYDLYMYLLVYALQSDNVTLQDYGIANYMLKQKITVIFTSANDLDIKGYTENMSITLECEEETKNKKHIK